jgi:hypothetical protein
MYLVGRSWWIGRQSPELSQNRVMLRVGHGNVDGE